MEGIEKDLQNQLRHLQNDKDMVDSLAEVLQGDPKVVASMEAQRRREARRAVRLNIIIAVLSAPAGVALSIWGPQLANLISPPLRYRHRATASALDTSCPLD
jgi:hypothetical protein